QSKIYHAAFFDANGHPHPCQGSLRVPVTHSYYCSFAMRMGLCLTPLAGTAILNTRGFPDMRIYLDYNATTPVDPAVLDAMLPYFAENFGNASSIHSPGQRARGAVDGARASVAA